MNGVCTAADAGYILDMSVKVVEEVVGEAGGMKSVLQCKVQSIIMGWPVCKSRGSTAGS